MARLKILRCDVDHARRRFVVRTRAWTYPFPFERLDPPLERGERVEEVHIDPEVGREGFTFRTSRGREDTVLADWVRDVNADPDYLSELLLHRLACRAKDELARSKLPRSEVQRRLGLGAAELRRLVDPAAAGKRLEDLVRLLFVLGCDVDLEVKRRRPSA